MWDDCRSGTIKAIYRSLTVRIATGDPYFLKHPFLYDLFWTMVGDANLLGYVQKKKEWKVLQFGVGVAGDVFLGSLLGLEDGLPTKRQHGMVVSLAGVWEIAYGMECRMLRVRGESRLGPPLRAARKG